MSSICTELPFTKKSCAVGYKDRSSICLAASNFISFHCPPNCPHTSKLTLICLKRHECSNITWIYYITIFTQYVSRMRFLLVVVLVCLFVLCVISILQKLKAVQDQEDKEAILKFFPLLADISPFWSPVFSGFWKVEFWETDLNSLLLLTKQINKTAVRGKKLTKE